MRLGRRSASISLRYVFAALILFGANAQAGSFGPVSELNSSASTDTGVDDEPSIASDGHGTVIAVWESDEDLGGELGTDYDILVSRSTDNGATWTTPAALNSNAATDLGDDGYPEIATDRDGNWIATWESYETLGTLGTDSDIFYSRSVDDGLTWSAPLPIASNADTDAGYDLEPQLASDGSDGWIVTWISDEELGGTLDSDLDVFFVASMDGGVTWTSPAALNSNAAVDSGDDDYVRIAADNSGNWVVVWQSDDSLGGTIGADLDILSAHSSDNGASWSAPSAVDVNADALGGYNLFPDIATDGSGNWISVWYSYDSLGETTGADSDIFASHSSNAGVSWSAPTTVNTNAGSDSDDDYDPQIASDGNGSWMVVWYSYDTLEGSIGTDPDVLAARSYDNGSGWSFPAAVKKSSDVDTVADYGPTVEALGKNQWIAAWYSRDTLDGTVDSDYDILHARLLEISKVPALDRVPRILLVGLIAMCLSFALSRRSSIPRRSGDFRS